MKLFDCDSKCSKDNFDHNMEYGMLYWQLSLVRDDVYHRNAKKVMKHLIRSTPVSDGVLCMAKDIRRALLRSIKVHLQFYNRDMLIALCVLMKQRFRAGMEGAFPDFWHSSTEYNVACTMIRCCYEIEEFEGNLLDAKENGAVNLISALALLRIFHVLDSNIDVCTYIKLGNMTIEELLYKPVEWEELEKHFEEYAALVQSDKPEDYTFENPALEAKLRSEHKDMESISKQAGKVIEQYFGFDLEVLRCIMTGPMQEVVAAMPMERNVLYRLLPMSEVYRKYEAIADRETVDKVLDTFTIQKAPGTLSDLLTRGFYEMRSIVRFGEHVFLAPYDLFQIASAFHNYALSGHFIDLYAPDKEIQEKFTSILKLISTFVVYTMVDVLLKNGYTLPQEKKRIGGVLYTVPMAEIKKIKKNGINILNHNKDLGDIDILACDEISKTIYNIEVKHYKPAVSVAQMISSDRSKVEEKDTVQKVLARESLIRDEMKSFLALLGISEQEEYKIKSLIITSRPNYFAQLCGKVECITWLQFCKQVETRNL